MRERIEGAGFGVVVHSTKRSLTEAEITPLVADIVGYVAGNDDLNSRVIDKAAHLRVISRQGAGFDRIDLEACTRRGIVVCNAFGAGAPAVAEFTFGSMLAVARKMFARQSPPQPGTRSVPTDTRPTTLVVT